MLEIPRIVIYERLEPPLEVDRVSADFTTHAVPATVIFVPTDCELDIEMALTEDMLPMRTCFIPLDDARIGLTVTSPEMETEEPRIVM